MRRVVNKFIFEIFIFGIMPIFLYMGSGVPIAIAGLFYIITIGFYFLMRYFVYVNFDKEETDGEEKLQTIEPPSDMHPAVASYFTRETVDLHIVYAVLLSLVNKRKIQMNRIENEYTFTLLDKKISLQPIDKYVLKWLFNESKEINMLDFKTTFRNGNADAQLIRHLKNMEHLLKEEVAHFIKDNSVAKRKFYRKLAQTTVFISVLSLLLFGFVGLFYVIFTSLLLVYQIKRATQKNQEGALEYKKWRAYRSFLKQRMESERRNVHDIILWDYHMTYALSLGVATQALNELDWIQGNIVEVMNGTGKMVRLSR